MLKRENVLAWCEIEHDLYEEDGHVFGVMLDLFNNHKNYYHRQGDTYVFLQEDCKHDIYDAIDEFNTIVAGVE